MADSQVNYDELAKQHGGVSDLDSLAKQQGGQVDSTLLGLPKTGLAGAMVHFNEAPEEVLGRFLEPFGEAAFGSLPTPIRKKLEGKETTGVDWLKGYAESDPSLMPFRATWEGIKGLKEASKQPTGLQRGVAGVSTLLPGIGPVAVSAGEEFGRGNIASGLGYFTLAAGPIIVAGAVRTASPRVQGVLGKLPTADNIIARNARMRSVIDSLSQQTGEVQEVAPYFRTLAEGELAAVKSARVELESQAQSRAATHEMLRGAEDAYDQAQLQKAQLTHDNAQRIRNLSDMRNLAKQVTGIEEIDPQVAAEQTLQALQGKKAFQDALESKLYGAVRAKADLLGISVAPEATSNAISKVLQTPLEAQKRLGSSQLTPSDISALSRAGETSGAVQQGNAPTASTLEKLDMGSLESFMRLSPELQTSMLQAIGGAEEAKPLSFSVMDQAQSGMGKMIRSMEAANNPEYASRIYVLREVRSAMLKDIGKSLEANLELKGLYDQAHRLTTEQHNLIDRRIIRGFFASDRYRLPAENIVRNILRPKTRHFQELMKSGLEIGPETASAYKVAQVISPADATKMATQLKNVLGSDEQALAGLRRAVVDEMLKYGTKPSATPGVESPTLDYNRMARFLKDRAGSRILLGDGYNRLLAEVQSRARTQLMSTNPSYDAFIQSVTKLSEKREATVARTEERAGAKLATKPVPEATAVKASRIASEDQFIDALVKDSAFADRIARQSAALPAIRNSIIRSLIDNATHGSAVTGEWGDPKGFIDPVDFGRRFNSILPVLRKFGNPRAVELLKQMASAAETEWMRRSTGIKIKPYFSERLVSLGPTGTQLRGLTSAPKSNLTIGPQDLAKAVSDPELARMLNEAARLPVYSPRAWELRAAISSALLAQGTQAYKREENADSSAFSPMPTPPQL